MKRSFLILLAIVLVSSVIFGGCVKQAPAPSPAPTPALAPSPAPAEPIRIGHLRPLTGHMAIVGERMVRSAEFAFEQAGYEVAGRKIEVIIADSGANPAMAIDAARKLVEHDEVSMIIGPTVGGTVMAVSNYMNKMGVPLIITNPSPFGVIAEKHEWTIMLGGTEPQISSCMGVYAYEELGYREVTVMTGDWVPGHGFLGAFMGAFKAKGGEVIQEQYTPVPSMDFAPYITALKDADAVVAWFDGADSMRFLAQFHEFGIRKKMPLIAAFHGAFFAPFILQELSPEAAQATVGGLTPTPYTPLLDLDVSKRFVAAYEKRYGVSPDDTESGPYQGALLALEALKVTGGDTTPERLRQTILTIDFEGPEGVIHFDPQTRSAIKNIYIVKIGQEGERFTWIPVHTYEGVPPPFGFAPPPPPPPGH